LEELKNNLPLYEQYLDTDEIFYIILKNKIVLNEIRGCENYGSGQFDELTEGIKIVENQAERFVKFSLFCGILFIVSIFFAFIYSIKSTITP
jgi:hypothetical protein